jgi:hypothetical protein
MNKTWKLLALLPGIIVPACADHAAANVTTQSEEALPICTWPASLDQPDAYTTACVASRTELNCGPVTVVPPPDAAALNCTNECMPTEYAVTCGGPGVTVPLPSGCRSLPAGPGGSVQGCCPCGS